MCPMRKRANNCSHGYRLALGYKVVTLQIPRVASATSPVEQHRGFEIRVEVRANAQQPFRVTLCRVRQTLPEPGFIDATTLDEARRKARAWIDRLALDAD